MLEFPGAFRSLVLTGLGTLWCAFFLFGCGSGSKEIVAVVGTDTLSVHDFEHAYMRTRANPPDDDRQKAEFLHRLVDYRVKLLEAKRLGLADSPELRQEVKEYRDQLALSFLLDRDLVEPGMRVLHDRRKEQIHVQHIAVRWERNALGERDTLRTLRITEKILDTARSGILSFDSLVMRSSDEVNKDNTRGNIGWFIAGTSYPDLDDIIYSLPVGEIFSRPYRSPFGYHIIKVTDRKPALQRARASQILYRLDIDHPSDTAAGYARLTLILDSLQRKLATFEELARRNSQDPDSGPKGGDLGWVDRGTNLESSFEAALFRLQPGQVSGITRTPFGLHIIKMTEQAPPPAFQDIKEQLRSVYRRERFGMDYANYMKQLRGKYGFTISPDVVRMIASKFDSSATTSMPYWERKFTEREKDAYLFRLNNGPVTVRQAIEETARTPALQMRHFTREHLDTIAITIANRMILLDETKGLEASDPEFARLVQEFEESSLVSILEQQEVLTNITVTDAQVRAYWERHRDEFRWPDRVSFSEIYVYGRRQAEALRDSILAGSDFSALASRNTRRPGYFEKGGAWGFVPMDLNELSRATVTMRLGEVSDIIAHDVGFSILKVEGRDTARMKTFEEAAAEALVRARQEAMDSALREWIDRLRARYDVEEFPENLRHTLKAGIPATTKAKQ